MARYYIYEHLLDGLMLIDTITKTWTLFRIHEGRIVNEKPQKITKHRINGLKKRLSKEEYRAKDSLISDYYIYKHILTNEERKKCKWKPYPFCIRLLAKGDDFQDVLKVASQIVFRDYAKKEYKKAHC